MARSQIQKLFQASLESNTEEVAGVIVGGEASMEAAMLSVEEARNEMDAAENDVEELQEIAEGLEAIYASVDASMEDGGLDAQSAQMMQLAVGAYTSRVGLEAGEITPSLESFGGDTGRQTATTVSLESLKENIRRFWNTVKTAIERAIKAVTDFFAKIFGGVDKVLERVSALEKAVSDAKGSASGEISVPNASALHVGGKVTVSDIKKGLDSLDKTSELIFGRFADGVASYYTATADKLKSSDVQKSDDESKADEAAGAADAAAKEATAPVATIRSLEMSGGKSFANWQEGEVPALTDTSKGPSGEQKISVPSKGDLNDILKNCKSIAETIKGKKDAIKKITDARKEAVKTAEEFVKAGEGGRLGKAWNTAKVNAMLRKTQRDLTRPVSQTTSHAFASVRAALTLVERAVKEYKEEAAS